MEKPNPAHSSKAADKDDPAMARETRPKIDDWRMETLKVLYKPDCRLSCLALEMIPTTGPLTVAPKL
jgi:hypothetical protein